MDKKILGGIAAGVIIAIVVAVVSIGLLNEEIEPVPIVSNEKIGLVINTPTQETTLAELNEIYKKAASTGIGRSNVYMFWNIVEPERGQFNWEQSDVLMSFNKKNDLKVTLYFSLINGKTLGPFPSWIGKPSLFSVNEDNLVNVLDAILTRYDIIDSVIIAGDTDSHFRYNEREIPIYKELFNNVYNKLKEKHPDVKIGNAYSLHGVINKELHHIVEELDVGDFVAFTYFPVDSLNDIVKTPKEAKQDLEKVFELVPNRVAFFEISWSTSDFVSGNEEDQTQFVSETYDFFRENESQLEFLYLV